MQGSRIYEEYTNIITSHAMISTAERKALLDVLVRQLSILLTDVVSQLVRLALQLLLHADVVQ